MPLYLVMCLAHVLFDCHIAFIFPYSSQIMCHFICNEDIIKYQSTRNKSTLVWEYNLTEQAFESICKNLCNYFIIKYIA
jgi:hypothetical protein